MLQIKGAICINTSPDLTSYINRILFQIAPTILGIKPAELIFMNMEAIKLIRQKLFGELDKNNQLEIKKVRNIRAREQFFVYHQAALDLVLREAETAEFLKYLGYPQEYNIEDYISILLARINTGPDFPHEAGVFLGYPLKDVLGFMGLNNLPYVGRKGWQYFGQYEESEQVFSRYERARHLFRLFFYSLGN